MERFDRSSAGATPVARAATGHSDDLLRSSRTKARVRTPPAYRWCEAATALLLCFAVVFSPWAYGTTQDWSIWTMNVTSYLLGALLLAKYIVAWRNEYQPPRWGSPIPEPELIEASPSSESTVGIAYTRQRSDWLTRAAAGLTFLILIYTFIGAVNARATYIPGQRRFIYHECIEWLPHSYDSRSTWSSLWMYIGFACFFWAMRDWLLGKGGTPRRRHARSGRGSGERSRQELPPGGQLESVKTAPERPFEVPDRLQLFLWVLCINGSILALEAILQRLSGTNKLLWLVAPEMNFNAAAQFGPYAYRSNAASYLNLLWPVCLGFWLVLRHASRPSLRSGHRVGSDNYLVLLPGAVLMAACPIISTSRGGAIVAVASIVVTIAILLWATRRESAATRAGAVSLFLIVLAFSASLGLKDLAPRFRTILDDQMSNRVEIYRNAVPIARDFPLFGTGPGSFSAVYQLYRNNPEQEWAGYVHDDWLETRIAFGWIGFALILLLLATILTRWFVGPGISAPWEFVAMIWVALSGCLVHGKFDFPFQIYSIVSLFLTLCAILFCVARRFSH